MKRLHSLLGLLLALTMVLGVLGGCSPSGSGATPTAGVTSPGATTAAPDSTPGGEATGPNDASVTIGVPQILTTLSPLGTTASRLHAGRPEVAGLLAEKGGARKAHSP